MTVSELTRFVRDCRDARLFHELTCPADEQEARDGFPGLWCRCPGPGPDPRPGAGDPGIIAGWRRRLACPLAPAGKRPCLEATASAKPAG